MVRARVPKLVSEKYLYLERLYINIQKLKVVFYWLRRYKIQARKIDVKYARAVRVRVPITPTLVSEKYLYLEQL
jgi:hypothetical protein